MQEKRKIGVVNITLYNFLARIIFFLFLFFAGFYASRILTKEEFGQAQYITWMVNFSWLILNLGGPSTLNRYLAFAYRNNHHSAIKKLVGFGAVALLISVFIALAGWAGYHYIEGRTIEAGIYIFLLSQFIANYMQVFMQGMFRYRTLFIANGAVSVFGVVFMLLFLREYRVDAYIQMFTMINLIHAVWYIIVLFRSLNQVPHNGEEMHPGEMPSKRSLVKTALYFGVSSVLAAVLWQRSEMYFLRQHLNFSDIAVYGIALTVISIIAEPFKIIPGVLLSYFSSISDLRDRVAAQFYIYFRHFCWLVIFACTFLWIDVEAIIHVLYTDKYLESAQYVRILLIGFLPGICSYVVMNMHVGLGRAKFLLIQDILSAALFIGLTVTLIRYNGLTGVSWAKTVAMFFSVAMGLLYTATRLHFKVPFKELFLSLLLSVLILYPLHALMNANLWLIGIKLVVTFSCYCFFSVLLKVIDRALVKKVFAEAKQILTRSSG